MKRLSVTECRPFIEFFLPQVRDVGLVEPLKNQKYVAVLLVHVNERGLSWHPGPLPI